MHDHDAIEVVDGRWNEKCPKAGANVPVEFTDRPGLLAHSFGAWSFNLPA